MREAKPEIPALCAAFHRAIELIGRRWTGAIVFVLLKSPCRFATIRDAIPAITDRMLSERLQELEKEGIVSRTVLPEAPIGVEYALTEKGQALAKVVDATAGWAHDWLDDVPRREPAGVHARPKAKRTARR